MYRVTDTATTGNQAIHIDAWNAATTSSGSSWTTKRQVDKIVTDEQEKIIREEVRIWMTDRLMQAAQKEAGQLMKDINNLKEEKTRLRKAISSLRQEMRTTKKEVHEEFVAMESMLERYSNQILRYENLDL